MEISSKTQYLIGYGTHFDGHALGAGQLTQDGMFGDGESVADPRRVEQNGVDQVLVHVGSLPVGLAGVEEEAQIRVGGPAQQLLQKVLERWSPVFLTDQIESGHHVGESSLRATQELIDRIVQLTNPLINADEPPAPTLLRSPLEISLFEQDQ